MTVLKVLAVLILLVGLAASFLGVSSILIVESSIEIFEQMRAAGSTTLDGIDLSTMRIVLYVNAIMMAIVGVLSVISAVGILLRKNWARLLWIGTMILMGIGAVYSYVMSTMNRGFEDNRTLTNAVWMILLVILLYYFSRERTKSYFVGR